MCEDRVAVESTPLEQNMCVTTPYPAEKKTYTVAEIQDILGFSRPTVYNLLKKKEFHWIQVGGGKYRISKKSFDEWLDKQFLNGNCVVSDSHSDSHISQIPNNPVRF